MRQGQDLNQAALMYFIHYIFRHQAFQSVIDCLRPWVHLVRFGARKVSQRLPTYRIHRAEDYDTAVFAALEYSFQSGAQGECRFTSAGASANGDDSDIWIHQQVQSYALLRGASLQAEGIAIAAHELHHTFRGDAPQRGLRSRY